MKDKKTLTFMLMDAPFENARTTTALRLIDIAARRGYDINVFAYEGAVYLPFAAQKPHANAVHGRDVDAGGPSAAARMGRGRDAGGGAATAASVDWVNCGLCVDERGAGDAIAGVRARLPGRFLEDGDVVRQHPGHRDQ